MTLRSNIERAFMEQTIVAWLIWLAVPVLCLIIPGPGVLLAGFWVMVFLWLGRQPAAALGFRRPRNSLLLIITAICLAAVIWLTDMYAITPLSESFTGKELDLSGFQDLEGNLPMFVMLLTLGWVVGGFIEELVFRGFLIQMGVRLMGAHFLWPIAIFSSIVFGLSHYYQGLSGVLATGTVSFLFAIVFIVSKRNLLLTMLVHGFVNTISFSLGYFGVIELA